VIEVERRNQALQCLVVVVVLVAVITAAALWHNDAATEHASECDCKRDKNR
jgi:hypothetical protein